MPELINIVKISGNIIDAEQELSCFLKDFAALPGKKSLFMVVESLQQN